MDKIRSAALVVNTQSRTGQDQFDQACAALSSLPFDVAPHPVEDPKRLQETVERAMAARPDLLIVGGGDGTISSLVDHLVGRDTILGVLPLGTANSFARTLGIPLEIEGAVEVLRSGTPRQIDLGMIDGDYFANCAAIGISPQIASTIPHKLKRWLGRAGYLAWATLQFVRFRPFELVIGEGADAKRLSATEVRISNGRFHGGVELIEEARLDSGEIIVQAVARNGRRGLLRNWGATVLGLDSRRDDTVTFHARELRIATHPPLPISIDGEVLAKTPVTARIAAGVIRVMAPASA
ncbi:diacylglycerol/lipid kinase family protein [Sphingomonas desiccabilis]|uniref:Diacylglycerol kinase n=1 Tax=Sphingomonas desiccabilis TaxID=429134 RepID=A0A4Q2J1E4_9SPHN|nr:diacylglycerol kinase family protein [Sphingomonas desiccabilis]MBB3910760.1 YegS/Rv2252/BmrU family lipid kinase [Sphingomonas desiccabilis]RXZ35371.1 diacylglycerol kinase [Sphingomonas desiccabilis]